jgi:hypothetical protein
MLDKSNSTTTTIVKHNKPSTPPLPNTVRGVLAGFTPNGEPLVDFCANPTGAPVLAASTICVQKTDIGREAVLLFEDGDPARPILLGLIQPPFDGAGGKTMRIDITVDGQRLTLCAEDEIVLRCGEASITLTKAGKVLIRGTYLLSRSSGPNRIKGGSVHLN